MAYTTPETLAAFTRDTQKLFDACEQYLTWYKGHTLEEAKPSPFASAAHHARCIRATLSTVIINPEEQTS